MSLRSYQEEYEKSMNYLMDDFESNLNISPIPIINEDEKEKEQQQHSQPPLPPQHQQQQHITQNEIMINPNHYHHHHHQPISPPSLDPSNAPSMFSSLIHVNNESDYKQSLSNFHHSQIQNIPQPEDIEEDDDEHLFMPISPTLSGSALRALLSSLRIKCKHYSFKSKQQNKFIMDCQHKMSQMRTKYNMEQMQLYDIEQRSIMLGSDEMSLEYLRGAELNQTRQELMYLMQKVNALEAERDRLREHCKLQQLENESHSKSVGEELERCQREICQHKVLYDQKGRELNELKKGSNAQQNEAERELNEMKQCQKESKEKLENVSKQMAALRENYEKMKQKYECLIGEKEKMSKELKQSQLEMEEKDQSIHSLKRVCSNLEQEIDALSRSNRNCREIRDKSTSQLIDSQNAEIEAVKEQIAQKYERFLNEEKEKNDKLQQLIKEMKNDQQSEQMDEMDRMEANCELDEFGTMMLKAAKQEIESLRQTNEKLMQLHAKNHFKKPRMQDQVTQTLDEHNNTINSSFITEDSHYSNNFDQCQPEKGDTVLINDMLI